MRKSPSLNLLIAFESAARHLSFKLAAEELFVTPSAISHQVRALEQLIEIPLFIRLNRSLQLTDEGLNYFNQISGAINIIQQATNELTNRLNESRLTIHCMPYFKHKYLLPNINQIKSLWPNTEVVIESSTEFRSISAVKNNQIEIAIRHGKTDDHHCYHELTPIFISPISAKDKNNNTLITLKGDELSWQKWQQEWNEGISHSETLIADNMLSLLEMTKQSLGFAMGYFPIMQSE